MKHISNPLLVAILSQVAVAAASATVSWLPNPEPDIAGYRVYYKPTDTNAMTTVWTTNTSVRVDHLKQGRTYVFYVTAINTSKLESLPSESVRYTPTMLPIAKLNLAP